MKYILTKEQLSNCVYYAGAGIDLQPLLRFSDMASDFLYVTAGLTREEFLTGVNEFIASHRQMFDYTNSNLRLVQVNDITIKDIEHTVEPRLIHGIPDYFNTHEYHRYVDAFTQFYGSRTEFHVELIFELRIDKVVKRIRLIHLSGEALATYDVIFRKQQIAPKVFISIQTNVLEIPYRITNDLFDKSVVRPKVWVRGVWCGDEITAFYDHYPQVFNADGLFNLCIGEFRNWIVDVPTEIEATTNKVKKYRLVKAYCEAAHWPAVKTGKIENGNLSINKILFRYNGTMKENYDKVFRHFPLSRIFELEQVANRLFAETRKEIIKIAILPWGYESFELMLPVFIDNYTQNQDYKLEIDIFYANELDLNRNI
jgi:hypothetical protein